MDPVVVTNSQWWQYGAIGVICIVFALTIRYLYNRKEAREDAIAIERTKWTEERAAFNTERERARAAFEAELHKIADNYAQRLREDRESSHEREDQIRKDFADLFDQFGMETTKMSAELTRVLDKIHDRFIGPRPRY